jgi:hypothetical protein
VLVEVGLFLYSGYGLFLALERGTYLIVPFIILYTMGMGYVASLALWQAFRDVPLSCWSAREGERTRRDHQTDRDRKPANPSRKPFQYDRGGL